MIQSIIPAHLPGANLYRLVFTVGGVAYIRFGKEIGQSLGLPKHFLDFRYIASFRNQIVLKSIVVEN